MFVWESHKAEGCWRWANFVETLKTADQPVLHLNMDETSLKLHVPPRPGFVAEPCPKRRRRLLQGRGGPDLKTKRAAVTLAAFSCNDEKVQQQLPQILIVNERVVTKAEVADIRSRCRGNVLVTRRKSSWVNVSIMVEIVKVLATCLRTELKTHHVILHMDVCSVHTHEKVLRACSDVGLCVHFIPAATTSLLQPLDVAVFSKFKRWVAREVERQRLASATGQLTRAGTLEVWRQGVDEVIRERGWLRAFEQCGLQGQHGLSSSLASRLDFPSWSPVGNTMPTLANLQAVFPSGRNIPIELLFQTAVDKEKAKRAVRIHPRARLPPLKHSP